MSVCWQVIVFLTTARLTQYYAELMSKTGIPVLEIHSRKSQAQVRHLLDLVPSCAARKTREAGSLLYGVGR